MRMIETRALQGYYGDTTGILWRHYEDTIGTLPGYYRGTTGILNDLVLEEQEEPQHHHLQGVQGLHHTLSLREGGRREGGGEGKRKEGGREEVGGEGGGREEGREGERGEGGQREGREGKMMATT